MIIDLHFHTQRYSSCSRIALEDGVKRAAALGLDAICITEHDVFHNYSNVAELERKFKIKIFSGVEILTNQGDIICFGLDQIPEKMLFAEELVAHLFKSGGATIAAHPFRDNNRGIKDLICSLPGLTAVEAWNGNTAQKDNLHALELARRCKIPVTGASDSHRIEKIGCFATEFFASICSERELINALRSGEYQPVRYNEETGLYQEPI
ncbi:PHP domain-containing protein [uncultured Sphaerochaeta sp.]|uniref:PHP domain-containing protein n=1 Tax=uncultured Sphaerochaeta sp. TaxID=886478 RepID=UPI002A0A7219|nr:PHP domain-containing protein [uncultured Sphaerochaeta sp.]